MQQHPMPSPTLEQGGAQLTYVPGWPRVNAVHHTQPKLCLKIFAGVNGPTVVGSKITG